SDVIIDVDVEQITERNENAYGVMCRVRGTVGQERAVDPELAAIMEETSEPPDELPTSEATDAPDEEATEASEEDEETEATPEASDEESTPAPTAEPSYGEGD